MTLFAPPRPPVAPLLLCALLTAPGPARAQSGDPDAYSVLSEASERFEALEALCAEFEQVTEVTLLDRTIRGRGTLCEKHPNLFSMRFADPEGDVVLVDGTYVWTYYPSMDEKQVIRFVAGGAEAGFNFYNAFLADPETKYHATNAGLEDVAGVSAYRLELEPRAASGFRRATVWVTAEGRLLSRVRIHDENGSVRTVTLSDVRLDPELPADYFTFIPPPGARVVTR